MKKIYLDNAATTAVDKQVLEAMTPYFCDIFGNASSAHSFGQAAGKAVEDARDKIAKFLNCKPDEIIFTSGATEADNIAVRGVVTQAFRPDKKLHIITTAFEHPAVLEVCKYLEKQGVEITYIKPNKDGIIQVENIKKAIKDNTILISVMYVNNEIGTIQSIEEIGKMIKEVNDERVQKSDKNILPQDPSTSPSLRSASARGKLKKIIFHTDAVQAVNYCDMDVKKLGVDLMSISGHKIYGPKGIGVLYVKKGIPIKPIQFGGHHEQGIRPGTLNVPGIVGLGKAIELISEHDNKKIKELRDYLWQEIQKNISKVRLNCNLIQRTPNNLNVSFAGVEGESLMLDLDLQGIAVSTGSACSSGSLEPSHVLMALGLSHEEAHGSLRISLGKDNTREEIDYLIEKLKASVEKFREISPIK